MQKYTKEEAKQIIAELVDRFATHVDEYKSGHYNETQTRNDYINPFFIALGWDINNSDGLAESYREVIHEDKIKVGGATKAPDYCFTIYGQKKFFVEAKKPSVSIKDSIEPAYQLRRYGWSAKLPISIITDFEEFAIYDCLLKPNPNDKASVSRIKYITYKDYIKEFDFIWDTFSKDNILKGSFDKYIVSSKDKRGTAGVDAEYLKTLDAWRDALARNIVNRNQNINEDELNFSLQKVLDRLIFLRICEDRGVEDENNLLSASAAPKVYESLKRIFHIADQKYNSGLFDYKKDFITDNLIIDDKTLKAIIEEMYYPKSPYEFSQIPVEILGHSYEQYLGKVIRITAGHRTKIEEKPEVRKAGGVYYTPQYIVDYIVKNTVGKLLEGKTPNEVEKIKICDPACGSGSFLLGAYRALLDWHLNYYIDLNIKDKHKFITPDGNLTSALKKQILLNNIYGVDIDTNAVEVTKLSLMLKAMEGETRASIDSQLSFLNERILPTLDDNIKSGNSLIDLDFYDSQIDFEPGAEKKIKPFNWQSAFPEVFKQGGFDAVIGNPPYVRIQNLEKESANYYSRTYQTSMGNYDIYCLFVEKSCSIVNSNGLISFILPHRFFKSDYGEGLRKFLNTNNSLIQIFDFDGYYVFNNASINTCIILLNPNNESNYIKYGRLKNPKFSLSDMPKLFHSFIENLPEYSQDFEIGNVNKLLLTGDYWNFIFDKEFSLYQKLTLEKKLGDMNVKIIVGLQTSADPVYVLKYLSEDEQYYHLLSKHTGNKYSLEKEIIFPLLRGANVSKYDYPINTDFLIFPYEIINDKAVLIEQNIMIKKCPNIWEYLKECKKELIERANVNLSCWWNYTYPKNLNSFCKPKIMTTVLSSNNSFTLDLEGKFYFVGGGNAGVYGIQVEDESIYPYLLGILNSKLANWFIRKTSLRCYQTAFSYGKRFIEKIPIPQNPDKQAHDSLVSLVDTMLALNKDLQKAVLPEEKERLKARIDYTDKKIDALVYKLYDLTEDEIRIIEN